MNTSFDHKDTPKNQRHSQHESQSAKTLPSRTIVHAKLEMTDPGDHDEQEADAMADAVVSGGKISRKISSGGGGSSGIAVSQQMESQLSQLQGGGRPMPQGLLNMMESGFGQDFGHVRIHTDAEAADMSSSISAKAFTLGNDIYFNRGQFNPETTEGQRLVAHELTHVVQGKETVSRSHQMKPSKEEGLLNEGGGQSVPSLFSPEELLLLNMLTYLPEETRKEFEGEDSLESIIYQIQSKYDVNNWNDETISTDDWMNVFSAIESDYLLRKLFVRGTRVDSLGGYYMLFISDINKEIVIAFRGTAPKEWADNFKGGGYTEGPGKSADKRNVITDQQDVALKTYHELLDSLQPKNTIKPILNGFTITVTGHSKGGNKAKFVALMNDNDYHSVGRCVSFDGQGFSDEFIERYMDRIKERKGLITNYNAKKDFVNILLNNVGKTHFLDAQNFSTDSFKENHSPEIMLNFQKMQGGITTARLAHEDKQDPIMIELDKFLNNFLRSFYNLKNEKIELKTAVLSSIGDVIGYYFETGDASKTFDYALADETKKDPFLYFCLFLIDYYDNNEAFRNALKQLGDEIKGISGYVSVPAFIAAAKWTSSRFKWREYFNQYYNYHYFNPSSTDGNDIEI